MGTKSCGSFGGENGCNCGGSTKHRDRVGEAGGVTLRSGGGAVIGGVGVRGGTGEAGRDGISR